MSLLKKICFITTIPGTLKSFVLKTADYIHNNTDWDISFICDYDEKFKNDIPEYIHYYPVKMKRGISLFGIRAFFDMYKIFKAEKFDLIQYSTPNASLYASLAGWFAKVPVRLYCQWGMVYVGFQGIKRKIFKSIEKLVCTLSTFIEPDSKSNVEFSVSEKLYSRKKSSVIWNGSACGVDIKKFDVSKKQIYRNEIRNKYNLTDNDFLFGFVGRITRDKGVNELLTAFKEISKTNKNAYLMFVGRDETDETVNQELYEWAKSSKNVIFAGYTDVVERYLSAMDIYILPSYREGFGMGVVEAEAIGVPVIVTNIPGPIDAMIENKTGLIVSKKNVDELRNAMVKIISEPEILSSFSQECVTHIHNNFVQDKFFEYFLEDRKKLLS